MIVDKSRPFIAERTAYEVLSLLRALLEKGVKPNEYHRLLMGRGQLMNCLRPIFFRRHSPVFAGSI